MAEVQKPVEVAPQEVQEETPVAAPVEAVAAPVEPAAVVEDKPTEEVKPAEEAAGETTEAVKAEEEKVEVKPIEEGHLSYKAQGLSFPKNLIPSKEFFFFGSDAVEPKTLAAYQQKEKSTETAHNNLAWAAHTGKGLLFFGDKKSPSSVINLSHASEPEIDGSNKFHFIAKGNKHSFKAATLAERDNWVAQLKAKIAEAKELATSITETEIYKNTLDSLKPAPIVKEEKPVEAAKEEAPKVEEAKDEDAAKEDEAVKTDDAVKEESKTEEPKRRSASRKRGSFFGFGKKEDKKEESKVEEAAKEEVSTEAPVVETAPEVEAPVEEVPAEAAPVAEDKPVEETSPAESPKEKPSATKRNSFFGGVFSKKEKKASEVKPAESTEVAKEEGDAPTAEAAPVIPPVETSTPLAVDVASPATVPTENVEVAATNGDAKKDVKEKRKSSLPFNFGKREKSPAPAEGEKSGKSQSPFSKLRSTIKGKSVAKAEEKPAEETAAIKEGEVNAEEEAKPAEDAATEEAAKVEEPAKEAETENKPENVAATTPVVTAAA